MNVSDGDVFTYLLVDNGLLQVESASYSEVDSKSRPRWLEPIYLERALEVSPILIDVEAAYEANDLDQVMGYVNARSPALHVSIIESELKLGEVARHLRRFIFILDLNGKQFTLRYADCAVIHPLSSLLDMSQWATMKGPITRWGIHNRSGTIIQLPSTELRSYVATPLCLDHEQLAALDEASEPDHFIAKVKMMQHGEELPGGAAEQHAWALAARQIWRTSNNSNALYLTSLTRAALVTRGEILLSNELQSLMAIDEFSIFRETLERAVNEMRNRSRRAV